MLTTSSIRMYAVSLAVCLSASAADADVIKLKSGRVAEGIITKVTDYGVTIKTKKSEETIMYSFIKDVGASENGPNSELLAELQLQYAPSENAKKVQFYMAPWCPYCRKMEDFLVASNITYEKLDIEADNAARARYQQLGESGIPVLMVNGTKISGYDPEGVRSAWDKWQDK